MLLSIFLKEWSAQTKKVKDRSKHCSTRVEILKEPRGHDDGQNKRLNFDRQTDDA